MSPTGKIYIGQSVDIRFRWKQHRIDCHTGKLKSSFLKHGFENHTFEILEECEISLLNERERYYQDFYDVLGPFGLNLKLTETNDRSGYFSEELKKKLSVSQKLYNSQLTEQEKLEKNLKNSQSTKGLVKSKEHQDKITKKIGERDSSNYGGWTHTEESKQNISKNKKKKVKDIITGEVFDSVEEACITVLLNVDKLRDRLTGVVKNNTNLRYLQPDRYKHKK